ncbi:hypothetical protein ACPWSR_04685 [Alloiococcus sp. CFN-8]|uniref:hypothetical protein n=1 Tax=Alloiococcus sp. CFN-8 TaxID=3416081 RepID=UPI003CF9ACC2
MKEIRVFGNDNKHMLMEEVNKFLKDTEYKVEDIQYGVSSGLFSTEYSAMIILEVNNI